MGSGKESASEIDETAIDHVIIRPSQATPQTLAIDAIKTF